MKGFDKGRGGERDEKTYEDTGRIKNEGRKSQRGHRWMKKKRV